MTEAVAVVKPKSNKTLFAGVLVFVLLVAFATAFYFLGGVDLVASAVNGLLGGGTATVAPPAPSTAAPSQAATTPASASNTTSSGLVLPPGVDEAFAKRMYVEQLESQANIAKLVSGNVSMFTLGARSSVPGGREIATTVTFTDKTKASGVLGLAQKQGRWYFVFISGKRGTSTGGEADTVAQDGVDTFGSNPTPLNNKPVDTDVLNTVLAEQLKSQDVFNAMLGGSYNRISIDKVTPGEGTATLEITLTGQKSAAMKGRVLCISKDIDGTKTWFITSFTKA
jgi:hypothetical protein